MTQKPSLTDFSAKVPVLNMSNLLDGKFWESLLKDSPPFVFCGLIDMVIFIVNGHDQW